MNDSAASGLPVRGTAGNHKDPLQSFVVVSRAPEMDYKKDYVALPKNYGSAKYFSREDVRAIRETVFRNLNDMDSRTGFSGKIRNRKVLIKPDFVGVYHKAGFKDDDYPESTDPRVLDSVVEFILQFTDKIVIVEGSGAPLTRVMAKINGTDRLVRYRRIAFEAVEEQTVDRYLLEILKITRRRIRLVKNGSPVDVDLCLEDKVFEGRKLTEREKKLDYIRLGLEPFTKSDRRKQIRFIKDALK